MRPALVTLCTTTCLAAITWYGFSQQESFKEIKKSIQPMTPTDHNSTLSKEEYANGRIREKDTITRMTPRKNKELASLGLKLGDPIFVRIFKESRELEIWVKKRNTGKFVHFKTWKIAAMAGKPGPKLAEGDFQAPEGFYYVKRSQMKPNSSYHLAINVGYPNTYDRAHNRTGSSIMIHGNRVSAGCFAMTDPSIEEIYTLCAKALTNGQPYFRVHIFPFRMTGLRLSAEQGNRWHGFWTNLKEGYDWFEQKQTPPDVSVRARKYVFK